MINTVFSGILIIIREFLSRWFTNELLSILLYIMILNVIVWMLRKVLFLR